MSTVKINGTTYTVPDGASVTVNGTTITVGSTTVTGLGNTTHIEWSGPVGKVSCQSITVHGDVNGDIDTQSIKCGNVVGDIDSQSVHCGDVKGDIDAMSVVRR